MVDRFHRAQDVVIVCVFLQRLSDQLRRAREVTLAQSRQQLAIGFGAEFHLYDRALLPLHRFGEHQRVLVLDVIHVDRQRLALPAQRLGLTDQRLLGETEPLDLARSLGKPELRVVQSVPIVGLEVPSQIVFAL